MKDDKWDEKEIKKVAGILLRAENNKGHFVRFLDEIIHWLLILIILLGNVILSGFVVIVSGIIHGLWFYVILALIALLFGLLIDLQLTDISKLSKEKHDISRFFLPILMIINIAVLLGMRYIFEFFTEIDITFNALIVGLIYAVFFLLPHLSTMMRR